jgi:hypothetical protein
MAILPPGVSSEQFDSAIRQFKNAVGEEWVFTSDEDLHPYRDHFSYINDQPNELIPGAAVGLARLYLWETGVSAAGIEKLRGQRPGLSIDIGAAGVTMPN